MRTVNDGISAFHLWPLPDGGTRLPVSLPKQAHDCAGDPHYFDLNTLKGSRLVAAVAEFTDRPEPDRPDRVRALLAQAGIIWRRCRHGGTPWSRSRWSMTPSPVTWDMVQEDGCRKPVGGRLSR